MSAARLLQVHGTMGPRSFGRLARWIRSRKESVLEVWEEEVRRSRSGISGDAPPVVLRDEMPLFLDLLADEWLSRAAPSEHGLSRCGELHALERFAHDLALGDVLAEYRMLRRSLLEQLVETEDLDLLAGLARLNEAFDHAMERAGERFAAEREDRLRRGWRYFAAVLDELPVAVALSEAPSGRIVQTNATYRSLFPEAPGAQQVGDHAQLAVFHQDETPCEPAELPLARALRGESVGPEEYKIRRGDQWVTVEVRALPLRAEEVGMDGAIAVLIDVSRRKRLEEQRDLFLGALAHDLRNPLNAIRLGAESLALQPGDRGRAVRISERISRSALRMAHLIDSILDFSRGLTEDLALSLAPCDLKEVLLQVTEEVRSSHPGSEVNVAGQRVRGRWDRERVAQIAQNLLVNALEHGAPDEPVEARVYSSGGRAFLEVSNRGRAIPPEDLPHLFEPYLSGRATGGLGLFIVHQIALAHDGSVSVESDDAMTKFRVELPLQAAKS